MNINFLTFFANIILLSVVAGIFLGPFCLAVMYTPWWLLFYFFISIGCVLFWLMQIIPSQQEPSRSVASVQEE